MTTDPCGRLDPDAWAQLASEAFLLGMQDAAGMSKPRTAAAVRDEIRSVHMTIPDARGLHWEKIRQVYGAGFDLGKLHLRLYPEGKPSK